MSNNTTLQVFEDKNHTVQHLWPWSTCSCRGGTQSTKEFTIQVYDTKKTMCERTQKHWCSKRNLADGLQCHSHFSAVMFLAFVTLTCFSHRRCIVYNFIA